MGGSIEALISANRHRQANGSPEVEDTENDADHDDVPGTVTQGPGRQEQFRNAMQGGPDGDVLQH